MLKVLLSLLLSKFYSKKEASIVGHQAMPSNQYTRLVSNGTIGSEWTAQAFSGVAAYDGYLFFAGTSTSAVPIVGIATAGASSNLTFPWLGARLSTTIPIAKGESWTVQGSNAKQISLELCKTIGGGYQSLKRFVKKGVCLCLSLSFNCLQKPSSKAKNLGLAFRECQKPKRLLSQQRWTPRGTLTQLHRTAMSFLAAVRRNVSCTTRWVPALIMEVLHVYSEDLSRFGKAVLCTITSKVRIVHQDSTLPLVSLSKLEKGGSLC